MGWNVKEVYGPEFYRIAMLFTCHICDNPDVIPHHVKSVKSGGKDKKNLVPLCYEHHTQCHWLGRVSFEVKHNLNLVKLARYYAVKNKPEEV